MTKNTSHEIQSLILQLSQLLYQKKARSIVALDCTGTQSGPIGVIICEGNVDRHVIALGEAVKELMKKDHGMVGISEGIKNGDWVVLDYLDVVIHILTPLMREKYRLEELWPEGKIIAWVESGEYKSNA